MTTLEIALSITNTLAGIGLLKSWRDRRSIDVAFWKETIEYQGKVIQQLREDLDASKERIRQLEIIIKEKATASTARLKRKKVVADGD